MSESSITGVSDDSILTGVWTDWSKGSISAGCGFIQESESIDGLYNDYGKYIASLISASTAYADQCYVSNSGGAPAQGCSLFVKRQIPQIISRNASCPFPGKSSICLRDNTNLQIDTGLVNSHDHFGINAAPQDRFTWRNVVQCGPLNIRNYTQIIPSTEEWSNSSTVQLRYGKSFDANKTGPVTFEWPEHVPSNFQDYTIKGKTSQPSWPSDYEPIPELQQDDAEMAVFFLAGNNVRFLGPVDDEFFAAHKPSVVARPDSPSGAQVYQFDDPVVHALGCTIRDQICLSKDRCTPLTEWTQAITAAVNLTVSDMQRESFKAWSISNDALGSTIYNTVVTLGFNGLIARKTFSDGVQRPLPPDQWQLEVEHWAAAVMAMFQRVSIEQATGPADTSMYKHISRPSTKIQKHLCESQKVRSTSHTSFSVLGLSITLILGGAIILLELVDEPLFRFIQRRGKFGSYKHLEWISNETLQLQRMAHEEVGAGTWTGTDESLPTTSRGERLATLNIDDRKHPRLVFGSAGSAVGKSSDSDFGDEQHHPLSTQTTHVSSPTSLKIDEKPDSSQYPLSPQTTHIASPTSPRDNEKVATSPHPLSPSTTHVDSPISPQDHEKAPSSQ
ncbi:MAG: hypothetical protein Q9160_000444 [Pyrenula sp. 1 TL-2023]